MKAFKTISILFIMISLCSVAYSQSKQEKETLQAERLKQVIESDDFTINANIAYPRGGRSMPLTGSYSLRVKNDSIFSHLPYFGRAYTIPYDGGAGLIFDAPIIEYSVTYNKKGRARILLTARTTEDQYKYTLEVYPNGSTTIQVNMVNRQSISFSGELDNQ